MELTRRDEDMLAGKEGPAKKLAIEGLIQLARAYSAPKLIDIGYAHIHAGMAMYLDDVQLMENLADMNARMAVPSSSNVANADMVNWRQTGAPENLAKLQQRAINAHTKLGSGCAFTCTPYWAGHWPTWNMHMTSIESTVTIFCNSVLGAKCNRDGFFAVYAGITGRYPLFGLHVDENRRGTVLIEMQCELKDVTDFNCLGFAIGQKAGSGIPVISGLTRRPSLDELDAMGAGMTASGGASMFIVPGVTPPIATVADAFGGKPPPQTLRLERKDIDAVYNYFCDGDVEDIDIIHVGCPHASYEEMKTYVGLFAGRKISGRSDVWITTSRGVRRMCEEAGMVRELEGLGVKVISDTCPMSCHFARTTSPDPALKLKPPRLRTVLVDSAKQAKYVRDMIQCKTLLSGAAEVIEAAVTGRLISRTTGG